MDKSKKNRNRARIKRVFRVRKKLHGSAERPRLSVSKTNCHIYAQLIDDDNSVTLAGFGTLSKTSTVKRKSKETAREIGKQIAELAMKRNINSVIFDRGRYKFHGIVAELANGAREAGLQF
ncbi:MAG: 50S ribosomal protein L18 [Chlamydiae bacterium CG10_big_fil_rev_8_21_14_0_10_42_34]|nr:MAG: 50S ribosomal protein L18 [Chlamydiae bacterium CG10_big_fil_rev_8_21_14_0_10_42_34]